MKLNTEEKIEAFYKKYVNTFEESITSEIDKKILRMMIEDIYLTGYTDGFRGGTNYVFELWDKEKGGKK